MNTLEILFFVLLFIVFYTYVGYGILLWILVKIKQSFISFYDTDEPEQETCRNGNNTDLPEITLFITAYNEEQVVDGKMKNCQELDYPKEKLHIVWVTDGSNDRTNEKLKAYPDVTLLFVPERKGKTAAMNREAFTTDNQQDIQGKEKKQGDRGYRPSQHAMGNILKTEDSIT